MQRDQKSGLWFGLGAYGLWGVIPLYFRLLTGFADSYDILCHRIVWSAIVLVLVLSVLRKHRHLWAAIGSPRSCLALLASSVLIGLNWLIYIYSVESHQVMHSSLGYFVTPLVNVAFGVFLLGEKVRRLQLVALGFGLVGLVLMAGLTDEFPWISASLAVTFSCYGLIRKLSAAETLVGLTAETCFLLPVAVWYLWTLGSAWPQSDSTSRFLLIASGPATVIPLYCFGQAARLLPMTYLGFLQYLSPSLQFIVAAAVFGEPLGSRKLAAFCVVWLGLAIFTWDAWRKYSARQKSSSPELGESL